MQFIIYHFRSQTGLSVIKSKFFSCYMTKRNKLGFTSEYIIACLSDLLLCTPIFIPYLLNTFKIKMFYNAVIVASTFYYILCKAPRISFKHHYDLIQVKNAFLIKQFNISSAVLLSGSALQIKT